MTRQRISLDDVTESALLVVDRHNLDALTLAAVAAELGVRPSALYTYIDGLDALRYAVAVASTSQLTYTIRDAALGQAGDDAIAALAHAYRGFATTYPGRYASTLLPPARRDDALATASNGLLDVFARVIASGYGHTGDDAVHAARAARSAIHGFVALEAGQGFDEPTDRDASFHHLVNVVIGGLR
jgi:AcrR family transcriptional regulator